jgi:YHS domain-containing protein
MVRWLLLAILFIFVVRALSRVISGVLEGAGYRREDGGRPAVKLVRDPVCGMFVTPAKALTSTAGGETQYFCSETCRRKWAADRR